MEINQEIIADMELNNTTDAKVQETIEQMETPAEDIQDGNSKNTTKKDSTFVREQLASQAEEEAPSYSGSE